MDNLELEREQDAVVTAPQDSSAAPPPEEPERVQDTAEQPPISDTEETEPSTEAPSENTENAEPSAEISPAGTGETEPSTEAPAEDTKDVEPSAEISQEDKGATESSTEAPSEATENAEPSAESSPADTGATEPSTEVPAEDTKDVEPSAEISQEDKGATESSTEASSEDAEDVEPSAETSPEDVEGTDSPKAPPAEEMPPIAGQPYSCGGPIPPMPPQTPGQPFPEMEGGGVAVADPPKKKGLKIAVIICAIVLVLALCVFGACMAILWQGGAFQYETYYRNTYINGVDCSGMGVDEAVLALTVADESYALTIQERDGVTETITGADIGLEAIPDQQALEEILTAQKPGTALLMQFFSKKEYEVNCTERYNEEQKTAVIAALACLQSENMVVPVDAALVMNADYTYEITPSVAGTTLDASATQAAISKAVDSRETLLDLESLGVYQNPTVTEDDSALNAELQQLQKLTSAEITYDFSDRTITCGREQIVGFLAQGDDGAWYVDEEKVAEWVKTELAYKTDTFGLSREFTTSTGSTVSLSGGDYGWCINRDKTTAALLEAIEDGVVETREPVYRYKGVCRDTNDIGGTYVEISISQQTLWCYKNGELVVKTSVVTGNTSNGNGTPYGGVWAIDGKRSPAVLGTYEVQGYESPVTYWMPFNGGVGLHDADGWRSSYGGSIYKTNGSHGCVNMPLSAAAKVYNTVSVGTPVVVYY